MNEREENELILKLIEKYNVSIGKVLVHPGSEKTEDRGHSATADAEHNKTLSLVMKKILMGMLLFLIIK